MIDQAWPVSCDTVVALPAATADGVTLFGKNSDRYPLECQRLVVVPQARHAPGSRVRCQYLEIPQAPETARVLGSQPYWLWGFEHGVNEHGVAIGNEMVATREPVARSGLLGMDLVRLGLERARDAAEAVAVITALIEAHGQGGSGQPHVDWAYHNSFLIADPTTAWVLETSGRHWALRAVREVAHITNHLSIGADWDRLEGAASSFAGARGWWPADGSRLDFARAYRDAETMPVHVSEGRARRANELLRGSQGRITLEILKAILRDHYERGPVYGGPSDPGEAEYFSLCMHAGSLMATTASMVVALVPDERPVAWVALGAPCASVYLPYYLDGEVPAAVTRGGKEASADSAWWAFRRLVERVEAEPQRRGPTVRLHWDALEQEVAERARQVERRALDLRARGDAHGAARLVDEFMAANVRAALGGIAALEA
jgi:dipeptidase